MTPDVSEKRLRVFIHTKLVNPKNERAHWSVRSGRTKRQREATAASIASALRTGGTRWKLDAPASQPKRIHFFAQLPRRLDDDNLRAACSPIRDGLQDCGIIHHDGITSVHVFTYEQAVAKEHGVWVTVELLGPLPTKEA